MVKLCDIPETAVFTWIDETIPLIATGTLSGVMDDNFSSDSSLSIYNPFESSKNPLYTSAAPGKFSSIDWAKSDNHSRGILACGLENSTIQLYDTNKILDTKPSNLIDARINEYKKHSTPVLQVCFNPLQSHILASSGSKGEIFIWDIKKDTSFNPGQAISPMSKVSSLAWNNNISHIFGTAGDNGYTSIWDLKAKREVLQLNYANYNLSVLKWHPTQSTKLVTASDNDNDPVILTWDLRNSSTPEKIMKGHKKGILSLDWCLNDPQLLLSSSKDDTVKLWNPIEAYEIATYPSLPNWVHQTKFSPKAPDFFASASLSKKIVVQSLQDTSDPVSTKVQSKNEDDFWNEISHTETQQPSFKVIQAPEWLKRPISATFGYGGKLVIANKTNVEVTTVSVNDGTLDKSAKSMITAISTNDFDNLCNEKIEFKSTQKVDDWSLLKKILSKNTPIESLLNIETEKNSSAISDNSSLSANEDDDDDFFSQIGAAKKLESKINYVPSGSFELKSSDDFENDAIKLLLSNKKSDVLDLCIEKDHILEALIISMDGPDDLKEKAKNAFFSKYANASPFSRLLYSSTSNSIGDIVKNADISSWNEIAKAIIKFSTGKPSFNVEMKLLGDRLSESKLENSRNLALSCYIAADALDKVSNIWLSELKDYEDYYLNKTNEDGSKNTAFEARFKALGEVIEKIVVFESTTESKLANNGDLSELGKAFVEYSDSLVNFGHYELAYKLLNMISDSIPEIKIEKDRISKAFINKAATLNNKASKYGNVAQPNINSKIPVSQSAFNPATRDASIPPAAMNNKYAIPSQSLNTQQAKKNPYIIPSVSNAAQSTAPNPYVVTQSANVPPPPSTNPYQPSYGATPKVSSPLVNNATSLAPAYQPNNQFINSAPIAASPQKKFANPYAPKTALDSLNNPPPPAINSYSNVPQAFNAVNNNPVPQPPPMKQDVGGWNDLPTHLAPVVKPTPSATKNNVYKASPGRVVSQPPSIAPPPALGEKSPYASKPVSQSPSRSSSKNPYAPKPEVYEPVTVPIAHSPLVQQQTPAQHIKPVSKNPYAPKSHTSFSNLPQSALTTPNMQSEPVFNSMQPPPPRSTYQNYNQQNLPAMATNILPPNQMSQSIPPPPVLNKAVPPPPPASQSITQPPSSVAAVGNIAPSEQKETSNGESSIPVEAEPIFTILASELEKVKPLVPEKFNKQVNDSEKRISILFEHLKNGTLVTSETINLLVKLTTALAEKNFTEANKLCEEIKNNHAEECGNWMVGIKRLVGMVEVTSK